MTSQSSTAFRNGPIGQTRPQPLCPSNAPQSIAFSIFKAFAIIVVQLYKPATENKANMVYTIVVHLYAKEDKESIDKLVKKLQEASQVYSNDKETLSWYV